MRAGFWKRPGRKKQTKDKKKRARELGLRFRVVYSPKDRDWPGPPKQLFPNLIRGPPVYSDPDLFGGEGGGGFYNQNPPLDGEPLKQPKGCMRFTKIQGYNFPEP